MNLYPYEEFDEFPCGLSMAFAQSPMAYQAFMALDEKEQTQILMRARSVQNRAEMRSIIKSLESSGH